jgi:DNA-binding CsgD family transcriptional regulator
MQPGHVIRVVAAQGDANMLDLLDSPQANASGLSAAPGAPDLAQRSRNYSGPERRGAASLQHRRMAQMLDTLDYGMLLLSETLEVSHINKAARRDMDAQHPLQWVGGQLQARLQQDQQPLRDALVGATQRGLRRLLQLGDKQGAGRQRISVAVVPLPALGADDQRGAAVLLGKRQVCEELTVEWFARSHGLTMAETTVIKGLCADLTPHEIAARQGVGLATIRTQIGSIRIKTGACSIRALVQQVALLPPLVSALQAGGSTLPADRVLQP